MRRVSRSKFHRLPRATAGFTTVLLVDLGCAVICQLPHIVGLIIRFWFIGSRF